MEQAAIVLPNVAIDVVRLQTYVGKLRCGRSFLNLVLINVATGINQHRLRQMRLQGEGNADIISLYSETEKIGALQKQTIARLEKLFKAVLKNEAFWEQTATWILTRLDQWKSQRRMPADCSIPGILSVETDSTLPEEEAWQESIVMSACAFYTAGEWLRNLDLSGFSVEDVEKLLGIRSTDSSVTDPVLFEGRELERVATGYPILTGAQALINSQWEDGEYPYWKKLVGDGFIQHNIVRQSSTNQQFELVPGKAAWEIIQQFGPEAAYVLLIFSSYATDSDEPWEQQLRIKGTDLIKLFGWDKRTDINLGQKLKKIGHLVELVCSLSVLISNINVGANRYNVARGAMWLLEELEYAGQLALTVDEDQPGSIHYGAGDPDELYIKVRPGSWTEKFLNAKDLNGGKEALCQYGYLAKSTLQINPYRQRLASKLAIFLTIMSRIRRDGRYEVGTLLERLEPKELMETVKNSKQRRNTLITQWDNALLTLHELGWQIDFDAATYPKCIRPDWSLTDEPEQLRTRPRNWLFIWLKAIVTIKPTVLIQEKLGAARSSSKQRSEPLALSDDSSERSRVVTGAELLVALDAKGWSKAHLAKTLGVDRSLITRWVKGERVIQPKHQNQIQALLEF
ncbi:MAG: helix-turn-helix transcriptional regulator [Oscillatoriophycideae cyanobacterium NC_groundwater_1537_Pr4_S-0.65um_50_18]|nr:helix-turn-helix transcriptional regulator [Oscillatoriophycideae cyanobacterium NC_groundwater_1537_Pr4_S-0.65um_50_18]